MLLIKFNCAWLGGLVFFFFTLKEKSTSGTRKRLTDSKKGNHCCKWVYGALIFNLKCQIKFVYCVTVTTNNGVRIDNECYQTLRSRPSSYYFVTTKSGL